MNFLRFVRWALTPCLLGALLAGGAATVSAQGAKKRPTPTPSPKAATPAPSAAPYVLPAVVATVNGEPIPKTELERVAKALAGNGGKALQDLSREEKKAAYATLLDALIVDRLVSKEAANERVDELDMQKRYSDLIRQYPNPSEFEAQVKKVGETTDQIKQNIRSQMAQQQWLDKQVADEAKVTPQEVEKFYQESPPSKFDVPEMVRVRHLLALARKDAPPEDALTAEEKAKAWLDRIKKGESFEAIARKESEDPAAPDQPATKDHPLRIGNGGDLGYFTRDRIDADFGDLAFRLKPNEIGGPVRTQFGYHLIQLLDHKPAHTETLDEARPQIEAYLKGEKRQAAVAKLVDGLRAKAQIQTFLPQ